MLPRPRLVRDRRSYPKLAGFFHGNCVASSSTLATEVVLDVPGVDSARDSLPADAGEDEASEVEGERQVVCYGGLSTARGVRSSDIYAHQIRFEYLMARRSSNGEEFE